MPDQQRLHHPAEQVREREDVQTAPDLVECQRVAVLAPVALAAGRQAGTLSTC